MASVCAEDRGREVDGRQKKDRSKEECETDKEKANHGSFFHINTSASF